MKAAFIGANPQIADLATLAVHLRWPDVTPMVATTAVEGLAMMQRESPDVVLLHPDFTDMTLGDTIRELRRLTDLPLLVLEHQGDEMEVVAALGLGADDYVRLPCNLTEIMMRIWALLRRFGLRSPGSEGALSNGRLPINPSTYEVYLGDQRVT